MPTAFVKIRTTAFDESLCGGKFTIIDFTLCNYSSIIIFVILSLLIISCKTIRRRIILRDDRRAEILISSKRSHQMIENIISHKLAHNDITAAQSHVLMFILHQEGDVYSSDIQKKLHISGATVSGLLKKLRANGYITLEGCDTDERRRRIIVTQKAHTHHDEISDCMSGIEDKAFRGFTDEETDTLLMLIKRMADNLKNAEREERDK